MEKEYVLVETVETFRVRYVIPTPEGKDEWALDTVTMDEGTQFSQEYLDEIIVSHRRIDDKEALALCNEDNDYAVEWTDARKRRAFFTDPIMIDGTIARGHYEDQDRD